MFQNDFISPMQGFGMPLTDGLQKLGVSSTPSIATSAATNPGILDSLGSWLQDSNFLGKTLADGTKVQGWGGMALGAGQGLLNAFMGMQQYGLAKKTLEENKRQFQLNYDAQKTTTNAALEDRQRARLAANPGAYESLSSYMDKNRIK